MKRVINGLLVSVGLVVASQVNALSMPLSDYNIIVENNFTQSGGTVYGSALIGGDILNGGPNEFASRVEPDIDVDSLTVLGDIKNSVRVLNGSLVVGGTIDSGVTVEVANHTPIKTASAADIAHFDTAIADLNNASDYYWGLDSNVTYSVRESKIVDLAYSGSSSTAVFTGSMSDIFLNANSELNFGAVDAESIIFNITDTEVNTNVKFPGFDTSGINGIGASNILWNFYNATDIELGGDTFMGSILAMNATVKLNRIVEGAIGAKSLTSHAQIHDYNFQVNPVPLPGSLVLFGTALVAFGAFKRKAKTAA